MSELASPTTKIPDRRVLVYLYHFIIKPQKSSLSLSNNAKTGNDTLSSRKKQIFYFEKTNIFLILFPFFTINNHLDKKKETFSLSNRWPIDRQLPGGYITTLYKMEIKIFKSIFCLQKETSVIYNRKKNYGNGS